jgi:PAS domain S-box-containing protein
MSIRKLTIISACGYCTILLCLLVISGWWLDIQTLRSIVPGLPETTPMTATLILLLGMALVLSDKISKSSPKQRYTVIYKVIITIVIVIAIFTGLQYIFNLPPSIETIFQPQISNFHDSVFVGRPSVRTVLTFLFIGFAMFFTYSKKRTLQNIAVIFSILGLVLPWIALFGYSTATRELYLIPNFPKTGMSPITALIFIILDLGVINLWPNKGIIGLFSSSSPSVKMLRIFLLIVTLVPLVLSWLVPYFIDQEYLHRGFDLVIEWGVFILFLAGAIIWGGIISDKRDLEKEELLNSLKQAEEQFRTLIELAPDAMIIVDSKGFITLTNEQSRKLFKYTEDEMIGMEIESLLPKQFSESHKELRESYYKSAQTRIMGDGKILRGVNKRGKEFPIEIGLSPIKIKSELMISAIVRDITTRIKAEDKIKNYVRNLGLVNQIARIAYYEADSGLDKFMISENFCNLFGAEKRMLSREEMRALLHPDDLKKFKGILDQALEKEENFEIEFRIINPLTKEIFHVNNYNYFTRDSLGNIQVLGLLQDVTQQKKVNEELIELNKNLEQKIKERTSELKKAHDNLEKMVEIRTEQLQMSNKELEAFSYSVSHDLRAPLRAITGFSAILKNDYEVLLGNEGKRIISIIVNNTTRMGQLIDDILVFSRLSRSELSTTHLNLKNIFEEVYLRQLEENDNTDRNIEFTVEDIPSAKGDRTMITQVIVNLVSNALKYTKPKERTIIRIGYEKENDKIIYHVKDNGVGFDERHKSKLFEVFQRLHNERDFSGTGIGLAIVQRVISKHGGQVWGTSVLNEGAVFYFTLP